MFCFRPPMPVGWVNRISTQIGSIIHGIFVELLLDEVDILHESLLSTERTTRWVPQVGEVVKEGTWCSVVTNGGDEVIEARVGHATVGGEEASKNDGQSGRQ